MYLVYVQNKMSLISQMITSMLFVLKQEYSWKTRSIILPLMPCFHVSPGQHQPWHWLCKLKWFCFHWGKQFSYMRDLGMSKASDFIIFNLCWEQMPLQWITNLFIKQNSFTFGKDKLMHLNWQKGSLTALETWHRELCKSIHTGGVYMGTYTVELNWGLTYRSLIEFSSWFLHTFTQISYNISLGFSGVFKCHSSVKGIPIINLKWSSDHLRCIGVTHIPIT